MITTVHGHIRTTDPDDAPALARLYDSAYPRAALLDLRREPVMPTVDEVREMLARPEAQQGRFYTVEDGAGQVCGFCGIRGSNPEAEFGEVTVLFLEDSHYSAPIAGEVTAFLTERAFIRLHLHKLVAHALDTETALAGFFNANGYVCCGVQRQVLYSNGRWHDLAVFACHAEGE